MRSVKVWINVIGLSKKFCCQMPCKLFDIDIDIKMNPNVNGEQISGHFISILKSEIYSLLEVNVFKHNFVRINCSLSPPTIVTKEDILSCPCGNVLSNVPGRSWVI